MEDHYATVMYKQTQVGPAVSPVSRLWTNFSQVAASGSFIFKRKAFLQIAKNILKSTNFAENVPFYSIIATMIINFRTVYIIIASLIYTYTSCNVSSVAKLIRVVLLGKIVVNGQKYGRTVTLGGNWERK